VVPLQVELHVVDDAQEWKFAQLLGAEELQVALPLEPTEPMLPPQDPAGFSTSLLHEAVPQEPDFTAHVPMLHDELVLSDEIVHVSFPVTHWGSLPAGHAAVAPIWHLHVEVSSLSGVPLQSLSFAEVQSRGRAVTAPGHVVGQVPFVQVRVLGLQMPMAAGPQVWTAPLAQVQESWGTPLQF
jgi:hypothetical protein